MINCEGRVREDRRAKGTVANSRCKLMHLGFSEFGIVGFDAEAAAQDHGNGKRRLEQKPGSEIELRGKRVVVEPEMTRRKGAQHRKGIKLVKQVKAEHDGEEKPVGAPPGANLTSRERAEKIIATALHVDPTLTEAVSAARAHGGVDNGLFDAVKLVQRAEAAKHVAPRNTVAAHLRSADEPSKLVAPFATKTTQQVAPEAARFSKRMVCGPEEATPRPFGIRRVGSNDIPEAPFDTVFASAAAAAAAAAAPAPTAAAAAAASSPARGSTVAPIVHAFYPDPPKFGKGREIQLPSGKRRVDVAIAPFDNDEIAQRKAVARCGKSADVAFPQFVLGEPRPDAQRGINASPEKNASHFSLGPTPSAQASVSAAASARQHGQRHAYAHLKNKSTELW
jgi:hypothetical protein